MLPLDINRATKQIPSTSQDTIKTIPLIATDLSPPYSTITTIIFNVQIAPSLPPHDSDTLSDKATHAYHRT